MQRSQCNWGKQLVLGSRKAIHVLAIAAAISLLPVTPVSASGGRLDQTRNEIRATRARLAGAIHDDASILAALTAVTRQLNIQQSSLSAAQARLANINFAINSEEQKLARLAAQRKTRASAIDDRARAMYIMGPGDGLSAITQSGSIQDAIGRAGALEYAMNFDRTILEDLAGINNDTEHAQAALSGTRTQAIAIRNEVADRVSLVGELVATRQQAHNALQSKIDGYRGEIAALQQEQNRIYSLIHTRSSGGGGPVLTGGEGRLGFAWPIRGQITSPYGPRWGGFHTGMDIDCATGDPIGAAKAGRVIAAEWGGGYGNMTVIDHGGGYSTLYAHQSRQYVHQGDYVQQHQRIGACGATGHATGDHLHFEVRVNGQHSNPRPYLP